MSNCKILPPAGEPDRWAYHGVYEKQWHALESITFGCYRKKDCAFPSVRNQINAILQITASIAKEL